MALLFDTGDAAPLATLVGRGVVELLQPLLYDEGDPGSGRGPYLRSVRQAPADPNVGELADALTDLLGPLPCAVVVVGDGEARVTHPTHIVWRMDIRVHCVSGYPGSWVEGRLDPMADDDRHDPGVRAIWQHVIEQIHWRAIETTTPGTGVIKPAKILHGGTTAQYAWWVVAATVDVQQTVRLPGARGAPPVAAIDAHHNVNGGGIVVTQRGLF